MSVNDLAETWRALAGEPKYPSPQTYRAGFDNGQYSARSVCAFDLESAARTAWRSVSEPPPDTDSSEKILFYDPEIPPHIEIEPIVAYDWDTFVWCVEDWERCKWAWPNDVVLLPPQSTTGEG